MPNAQQAPSLAKNDDSRVIGLFLEALMAERGISRNTYENYQRDLISATLFLQKLGLTLQGARTENIADYLEDLHHRGLSPKTRTRHLSSLRSFFRFWCDEPSDMPRINPTLGLPSPKLPKQLPRTLSLQDIQALLTAADQKASPQALRGRVCLLLLYTTGLRVSELLSLTLSPIKALIRQSATPHQTRLFQLSVTGKGRKERIVMLPLVAIQAVKDYLAVRDHFLGQHLKSPLLFPSPQGTLTRQTVFNLLKKLAVAAGVPANNVSPHVLRHAFASHLLAGGSDLVTLQKLLGHSHLSTVQIYTHLQMKDVCADVTKKHPLAFEKLAKS